MFLNLNCEKGKCFLIYTLKTIHVNFVNSACLNMFAEPENIYLKFYTILKADIKDKDSWLIAL